MRDVIRSYRRSDGCVMDDDETFGKPVAIVPLPIPDAMVERAAREEFFALRPDGEWSKQRRDTKAAYMERARMILTAALTPEGR